MGNRYRVKCTGSVSGSTENRGLVENGQWISCENWEILVIVQEVRVKTKATHDCAISVYRMFNQSDNVHTVVWQYKESWSGWE